MMFWNRRPISKNLLGILLFLLLSFVAIVFVLPILISGSIVLFNLAPSEHIADRIAQDVRYQPFLYLALLVATILTTRLYDRMPLAWVGLRLHPYAGREIAWGIALGLTMTFLAWLPTALIGTVEIGQIGSVKTLVFWSIILLANAAGEEILFRGYLFQRVVELIGPIAGTLLISGGFAAAHLGNPGISPLAILNVFLAGVLFSACLFATGSLWLPIALHAAWNIALALLFGAPMSGMETETALLRTTSSGPALLTGGAFGPEAGITTTAILLLAVIAVFRIPGIQFSPFVFSQIFWGVHRKKKKKLEEDSE